MKRKRKKRRRISKALVSSQCFVKNIFSDFEQTLFEAATRKKKNMTGRDYRKLIKLHRELNSRSNLRDAQSTNENYKFISRLIDKQSLINYQQIDYSLFKNFINERKLASEDSLAKVKQIEDLNRLKKEQLFSRRHVIVWLKEHRRLEAHFRSLDAELEDYFQLLKHNSVEYYDLNDNKKLGELEDEKICESFSLIDELEKYATKLNREQQSIRRNNDRLVSDLREDLRFHLSQITPRTRENKPEQNETVLNTIHSVRDQFSRLIEDLDTECRNLSNELRDFAQELDKNENRVREGVPERAYELECPDEELRVSVLQEFHILDFKYREKLRQLDENYAHMIKEENASHGFVCGWPRDDHDLFEHFYEQYHTNRVNLKSCNFTLRDLMFDKMRQAFASLKSKKYDRSDFVRREEYLNASKHFGEQKKLILSEWNESRCALLEKAEATFAEAFELLEMERKKQREKENQLNICNKLYEKVSKWRMQKLEALELQQAIDHIIAQQNEQVLRVENEKKMKKRDDEKRALAEYHRRNEMHKKQLKDEEQARLNELKKHLQEQAVKDRERIEFRNKLFYEKKLEQVKQKQDKLNELELREERLEKNYESRRPKVERDPARLVKFTEAELHRRGIRSHSDHNQSDLFQNFGFNDKQLSADSRLRIEERLRQAGLINNEYARAILNSIKQSSVNSVQTRRNANANSAWNGFAFK